MFGSMPPPQHEKQKCSHPLNDFSFLDIHTLISKTTICDLIRVNFFTEALVCSIRLSPAASRLASLVKTDAAFLLIELNGN